MNRQVNFNEKGATNVRIEAGSSDTTNEGDRLFDSENAEMIRDESRWDAFQLMGDTNAEEMKHRSSQSGEKSAGESAEDLRRARAFLRKRANKVFRAVAMR